jgi:hypothetical protein
MLGMPSHAWHFFSRFFLQIPALVSQNWTAFGLAATFLLFRQWQSIRKHGGWKAGRKAAWTELLKNSLFTFLFGLVCWAALSSFALGRSVYLDHQDVVRRWTAVVNEKNSLKGLLGERDQYIRTLERELGEARENATRPAQRSIPPPALLPPSSARLNVTLEPRVNSRPDANFETEVTVSTTVAFPGSLTLTLTCDHPLLDVQGNNKTLIYMREDRQRNVYTLSYQSALPNFSPASPFVFHVWSKEKLACTARAE